MTSSKYVNANWSDKKMAHNYDRRTITAGIPGTVGAFVVLLQNYLQQYDRADQIKAVTKGTYYNPSQLAHLLKAWGKVNAAVLSKQRSSDPKDFEDLKVAVSRAFVNNFPPSKKLIKAVDKFLETGKTPNLPKLKAIPEPDSISATSGLTAELSKVLNSASNSGSIAVMADKLNEKLKDDRYGVTIPMAGSYRGVAKVQLDRFSGGYEDEGDLAVGLVAMGTNKTVPIKGLKWFVKWEPVPTGRAHSYFQVSEVAPSKPNLDAKLKKTRDYFLKAWGEG